MIYSEYVKFLKSKNINLFDHEYRISYKYLFILRANKDQIGGGNYLHSKSNKELLYLINITTSQNPNYIYSLI